MATDTAAAFTRVAGLRLPWQVPAFLLGAATMTAVALARPQWHHDGASNLSQQLANARKALAQSPPDSQQALAAAQKVLDVAERYPQFAAEANFLVASAKLRSLDITAADAATLTQIRQLLERAKDLGIGEADQPKLKYRLAKVLLLQGQDTKQAMAALAQAIEIADDPAEDYGLLAEAYLKQNPPDPAAALEATKQQLGKAAPASDARQLAQARLRLGELYLKANNIKDGRATLERIGSDAPRDVFFAARNALAESYESSHDWGKAARNWEIVRANPKLTGPAKGELLLRLGHCLLQDQRNSDALAVWQEAATLPGDDGQAAALKVAALRCESEPTAAAEAFAAALQAVRSPADYRNRRVPLEEARQMLERSAAICRTKGDAVAAQRLVELYARLAPPGRDDELLAEAADGSAQSLTDQANQSPEQAAGLSEQARGQYLIAARAYERAAGKVPPGPQQALWLWKSADRYLKAQQQQAALDALTRLTQLAGMLNDDNGNNGSKVIAEAWFQIGSIHYRKQQYATARAALQHCVTSPGPFTLAARHQIAMIDLIENRFDDAEQKLQENRSALRAATDADASLVEKTEFALADVAYQRQGAAKEQLREYTTAEQRYRGAIQQFPQSAEVLRATFHLGQCHYLVAKQKSEALGSGSLNDEERKAYLKQYRENLESAAEQYGKVEAQLLARQEKEALATNDYALLRQTSFLAAHCCWYLDKFDDAQRRYSALALRYQGQVWELGALSQVFQCYRAQHDDEKAKGILPRIQAAYDKMPDAAFTGDDSSFQRSFWVQWLADATKAVGNSATSAVTPVK